MGDGKTGQEIFTAAEDLSVRLLKKRKQSHRPLPTGIEEFREVQEGGYYYVDKTRMIKDFLEIGGKVTLVIRPRRFGKTLNMTMIRDFFDITQDSRSIFDGLYIMQTEYAEYINSVPVVYFSFKNCMSTVWPELLIDLKEELYKEYERCRRIMEGHLLQYPSQSVKFNKTFDAILDEHSDAYHIKHAISTLTTAVQSYYHIKPILIIDEYDQPIMSSYEHGYHDEAGDFFSSFYDSAMKGNASLERALLTGVQKVAQESIFSKLNNVDVYTVLSEQYSPYFGLTKTETDTLLHEYGLEVNDAVNKHYNGYLFFDQQMYNPWSILKYAKTKVLDNYWVKTSSNTMIIELLKSANSSFLKQFNAMVNNMEVTAEASLESTYISNMNSSALWGLLINAGYLTAIERINTKSVTVKIPNDEVMEEFKSIIAVIFGEDGNLLREMFTNLIEGKVTKFMERYKAIVLYCTSFMDAAENSYHMLCLGMAIYMAGSYKITSNHEAGNGRYDIRMESKLPSRPHVLFEFKRGEPEDLKKLSEDALWQIKSKGYSTGLEGDALCVGIAHSKKHCEASYEMCHARNGLLR